MGSELEPAVRTEETPEARILEIDLPGFRREDLRVQVNNRGSLVISGERGAKEMEEMAKAGSRSETQRVGQRFRKVISVPENFNFDGVTAKFRDERLSVSLPVRRVTEEQNQDSVPDSRNSDQSLQSNGQRSSPAGQEYSRMERPAPAPAQEYQTARHPEANQRHDDKEKPTVTAEKSNELQEEKKAEAPQQAKELVGEPPISTHAKSVSDETCSAHQSECIQSKSKPEEETLLQDDGGQKSGKPPEGRHPPQEKKKDEGKAAEKGHDVVGKEGNGDGVSSVVEGYIRRLGNRSTWRIDKFLDQKRNIFPASCSSTFCKHGVLIASSVLVLSVGFYITYKSRSRHRI